MEALRLLDFVTVAIKRSGRWMLLLDFWPTDDEEADWSSLGWTLPWLSELGDNRGRVCDELRRHGLALVSCADEEECRRPPYFVTAAPVFSCLQRGWIDSSAQQCGTNFLSRGSAR
jgi:hypothetical protein